MSSSRILSEISKPTADLMPKARYTDETSEQKASSSSKRNDWNDFFKCIAKNLDPETQPWSLTGCSPKSPHKFSAPQNC